jgi:hypothetical protein
MERLEKYLSRNWLCCGFIALFTLAVWGQTIGYGFVWDDDILVARNPSIRSFRNLPAIFTRVEAQSQESAPSFRPIRTAFYAVLYAVEGQETPRPWIYHLSNILWHAAAAVLLFLVALRLWERLTGKLILGIRVAALLVALGFAANPANSESVCWIKCLDDLMAGVFVLASAYSLLQWNGGWRRLVMPLVWFFLASASYESAVPFAAVAFLLFYGFHRLPWRKCVTLTIPFLAVAAFYVGWRQIVIGRASQCAPLSGSYGQTLIDMFPVAPQYLRLLCGIPPFCIDYNYLVDEPPYRAFSGAVLGGVALVVLWGGLTVGLWWNEFWLPAAGRQWRRSDETPLRGGVMAAFGLAWIGLFLLPVSNLVPMMQFMAERFLYLPMMGFLLAASGVLLSFSRPRWVVAGAATVIALWAGISLDRMTIWQDGLNLFVRTELEHPGIRRVQQNAVSAIYNLPQMDPLFPDYRKTGSVRMADSLTPAEGEAIIETLEKARQLFPTNALLTTDLAFADAKVGRWQDAVALAKLAVQQKSDSAQYWLNLASMLLATGNPSEAKEPCAQALRLKPDFAEAKQLQLRIVSRLTSQPKTGK